MSYCRFSTDCYQSDVYVYDSDNGIVCHVASNRLVSPNPRPKWTPRQDGEDNNSYVVTCLVDYMRACSEWAKNATRTPIGLSRDGRCFTFDTPSECIEGLEIMRAEGYVVPQSAIDALREEAGA